MRAFFVPESSVQKVISEYHSKGHLGVNKTLLSIKNEFVFQYMLKKIKQFIRTCSACQKNKTVPGISPDYGVFKEVTKKFQVVHVDILKLPNARGYKSVSYTHLTLTTSDLV